MAKFVQRRQVGYGGQRRTARLDRGPAIDRDGGGDGIEPLDLGALQALEELAGVDSPTCNSINTRNLR